MLFTYEDGLPVPPPGTIYYPEPLRMITPALAELNSERAGRPEEFAANLDVCYDMVVGFLRSIRDAHAAGLAVHDRYRRHGDQYALYLRSFTLAGQVVSRTPWRQTVMISADDLWFREGFAAALPAGIAQLSFVNTLDRYPRGEGAHGSRPDRAVPAIRVLSHNWQAAVREGVRGANFVVMYLDGPSEGVAWELRLLRECGMAERTVVVIAATDGRADGQVDGFPHVLAGPDRGRILTDAIAAMTGSGFRQTTPVGDLATLPCWVLDRRIELARHRFTAEELAGVPYDHFVPSSLVNNTTQLMHRYQEMEKRWRAIEAGIGRSVLPSPVSLMNALSAAVATFYLAVLSERYAEMAMALSTAGLAYKALTGDDAVLTTVYGWAAECARWSTDTELAGFLTRTHRDLLTAQGQPAR